MNPGSGPEPVLLAAGPGTGDATPRWPRWPRARVLCSRAYPGPGPARAPATATPPRPGGCACRRWRVCGVWVSVTVLDPSSVPPALAWAPATLMWFLLPVRHLAGTLEERASVPACPPPPVSPLPVSTAAATPMSSRFCVPARGSAFSGAGSPGLQAAPGEAPPRSAGNRQDPRSLWCSKKLPVGP